jgi:hypothetical protein
VVAITYRTDGPWGTGKGSNLTPAEIDTNFHNLNEKVEEEGPPPVGIATIEVQGQTFVVILTDATELGPFPLPVAAFRWVGSYNDNAGFDPGDVFTVEETPGILDVYLTTASFEKATAFDATETDTEGAPVMQRMFSIPDGRKIVVEARIDSFTLAPSMAGKYQRTFGPAAIEVLIPTDEVATDGEAFEDGMIFTIRHGGSGTCELSPATGVTLYLPPNCLPQFRGTGATVTLVRLSENEYDVAGDLALEEPTA